MEERKFDEIIGELPRTFRPPVEPRYDEMWSAIEAAHFDNAVKHGGRRRLPSIAPWLAAAATLLIGIAIGRGTATPGAAPAHTASTPAVAPVPTATAASDAYRDQTTRYLAQAAALLIALPGPTSPDRYTSASSNSKLSDKASDLLVTTRLLLDSPASQDPQLHSLLEDLELVFAQIARLPIEKSKSELDLIHQAVEQGNVLSRLNSVVTNTSAE
ncbi:MAG: hypothetical protein M3Z17_02565 [Gemmatimonadota bacterium]|nr:hypothetical protein [Gemmatimonadota bacterium]